MEDKEGPILIIRSHNKLYNPENPPSNLDIFSRCLKSLNYDVRDISCSQYFDTTPKSFAVVRWIPNSLFGYLKTTLALIKLILITMIIIYCKDTLKPMMIVVEELTFMIPWFNSQGIRVLYFEDEIRNLPILKKKVLEIYRRRHPANQLLYLKFADRVVVCTSTQQYILTSKVLNLKINPIVLYPNVETPEFLTGDFMPIFSISSLLSTDSIVFTTFGDFIPDSNFDLAINCLKVLQANMATDKLLIEKVFLIVCGQCDNEIHRDYLKHLTTKWTNVKNLIFLTNVTYHLKKSLILHSKGILFTSVAHNHDQTLFMQCLRMGKVTISTDCTTVDELIRNEKTGYICDPIAEDFANILEKVIGSPSYHNDLEDPIRCIISEYYGCTQYSLTVKSLMDNLDPIVRIVQIEDVKASLEESQIVATEEEPASDDEYYSAADDTQEEDQDNDIYEDCKSEIDENNSFSTINESDFSFNLVGKIVSTPFVTQTPPNEPSMEVEQGCSFITPENYGRRVKFPISNASTVSSGLPVPKESTSSGEHDDGSRRRQRMTMKEFAEWFSKPTTPKVKRPIIIKPAELPFERKAILDLLFDVPPPTARLIDFDVLVCARSTERFDDSYARYDESCPRVQSCGTFRELPKSDIYYRSKSVPRDWKPFKDTKSGRTLRQVIYEAETNDS